MSDDNDLSIEGVDIEGKHVVLREEVLAATYRDITWRVVQARTGFGCKPYLAGRAVFVEHVRDGEKARFDRSEIERLATDEEVAAATALREESSV